MICCMTPNGLGHNALQLRKQGDLPQHHPGARRASTHQRYVGVRNAPRVVAPAVGASPRYRRRQHHVKVTGGVAINLDGRQMVRVRGVGQPVHLGLPSECRQRDDCVIQRCATTQQQIAAVRIGVGQTPVRIGIQMQTLGAHPPPPGLGIMDRRRPGGERQRGVDRVVIREASVHGPHCSPCVAVLTTSESPERGADR